MLCSSIDPSLMNRGSRPSLQCSTVDSSKTVQGDPSSSAVHDDYSSLVACVDENRISVPIRHPSLGVCDDPSTTAPSDASSLVDHDGDLSRTVPHYDSVFADRGFRSNATNPCEHPTAMVSWDVFGLVAPHIDSVATRESSNETVQMDAMVSRSPCASIPGVPQSLDEKPAPNMNSIPNPNRSSPHNSRFNQSGTECLRGRTTVFDLLRMAGFPPLGLVGTPLLTFDVFRVHRSYSVLPAVLRAHSW